MNGSGGDLAHALRLLASGRTLDEAWGKAGYESRKHLSEAVFELSGRLPESGLPGGRLKVTAYSDGASVGNPGRAGCGVVILSEDGTELAEWSRYIGKATSNVAEYRAAILALEKAHELGAAEIELRLDSELVARQIKGEYRVKDPTLAKLHQRLKLVSKHFESFAITHIARKDNKKADSLANLAIAASKEGRSGAG